MRFHVQLTCVLASLVIPGSSRQTIADDLTPREIVEVLKNREKSLTSGRVEWEERTVQSAGSRSQPGSGVRFPAEDETTNATRKLAWDGELMSYRFEDQTPAIDQSKFVPMTYANVCGGPKSNRAVTTNASIDHPMATVTNSKLLESTNDVNLIPILLWAKPSAGESRIKPDECQILPDKQSVEGRDCVVLTQKRGIATDRLYIDIERDCAIMRYEILVEGICKVRIDVEYVMNEKSGWVPSGWQTIIQGSKDRVSTVRTGTVKLLEPGAKPDPKLFELDWPRGALVDDRIRRVRYVVRLDGTERILRPGDIARGMKYSDLLKPEPGK